MMPLHQVEYEEALKVATAMQKFGGSFVKSLAIAISHADPLNLIKIKKTWPNYWNEYLKMYRLIKDRDINILNNIK